jgi:hypothetical protein
LLYWFNDDSTNSVNNADWLKGALSAKIVNFCYPQKLSDMIDVLIKRISVTYKCYEYHGYVILLLRNSNLFCFYYILICLFTIGNWLTVDCSITPWLLSLEITWNSFSSFLSIYLYLPFWVISGLCLFPILEEVINELKL